MYHFILSFFRVLQARPAHCLAALQQKTMPRAIAITYRGVCVCAARACARTRGKTKQKTPKGKQTNKQQNKPSPLPRIPLQFRDLKHFVIIR